MSHKTKDRLIMLFAVHVSLAIVFLQLYVPLKNLWDYFV